MNSEFSMQLETESGAQAKIIIKKKSIEFIFQDGTTQARNFLTRSELKDLAKICHFAWENSAVQMRASATDEPKE